MALLSKNEVRTLKAQIKSFTGFNEADLSRWWKTVHPVIGCSPEAAEKDPKLWHKLRTMVRFSNVDLAGDFKPARPQADPGAGETGEIDW